MNFPIAPGATPIDDLSQLRIPITTQSQLDAFEFDNIFRAEQHYFQRRKFSDASWFKPVFLQNLHAAMFDEVWEWGGKYRIRTVLPIGVEPYKIPMMLAELAKDVEHWLAHPLDMAFLEMAARIHQRLTWIHPFPNGNGRFSRFVSNLFLFSYRCALPIWPGALNRESTNRSEYLATLREADQGDFQPLIDYLRSLGAKNPSLGTFIGSKAYSSFQGTRLMQLCTGLILSGENINDDSWNGHKPLQMLLRRNETEASLFFIEKGADIHSADRSGLTPFQAAVLMANKRIADLLILRGVRKIAPPGAGYANYYNMYHQLPPN